MLCYISLKAADSVLADHNSHFSRFSSFVSWSENHQGWRSSDRPPQFALFRRIGVPLISMKRPPSFARTIRRSSSR
jgi:hypothetical protein